MKVLFVAGFGPVVEDMAVTNKFYAGSLGIPLEGDETYQTTEAVEGDKHFALWPLSAAAESCFGDPTWPEDLPRRRLDRVRCRGHRVGNRRAAGKGYRVLLVADKLEPWGQRVTRLIDPDGMLVGITYTPHLRGE